MRATKFNKKLSLNKLTVANLNLDAMKEVKGGGNNSVGCSPLKIYTFKSICVCRK